MPDFSATFVNPSSQVVDITISNSVLTIKDWSNYYTSTEAGHLSANFSGFKKIVITLPDLTEYVYSTLGDGDITINPPSSYGVSPLTQTYTVTDEGVYMIDLYVVPTYNAGVTYAEDDSVYYNSKIYASIVSSNVGNTPSSSPTYWKEISFENVPDKYSAYGIIAYIDSIQVLWADLVLEANEDIDSRCIDNNLCSNELMRKAMRLDNLLNGIQLNVNLQDYDTTKKLYDEAVGFTNCI